MNAAELDQRLRRIEGLLGLIVRELEVRQDERNLESENQKTYRRGYQAGRAAQRRGDNKPLSEAVRRQRGPYRPRVPSEGLAA